MPHQDMEDFRTTSAELCTPLAELKELLAPIQTSDLSQVQRHGNAVLNISAVACMALLTFGWNQQQTLSRRFDGAHDATKRLFVAACIAKSYQALMVALRSCGDAMCQIISTHLVNHLCNSSRWLIYGRPTFAVDRTKFAVPRTNKNLSFVLFLFASQSYVKSPTCWLTGVLAERR